MGRTFDSGKKVGGGGGGDANVLVVTLECSLAYERY